MKARVSGIMLVPLLGMLCIALGSVTVKAHDEALLVKTDKRVYVLGEEVKIILTNISNETLGFGGWPPCDICRIYPDWEFCYPKVYAWLAWHLDPGESIIDTWNQYNEFTGSYVKSGMYMAYEYNYNHTVYFAIIFLGDVNFDGVVDMRDVYIVARSFGSYPDHPRWNFIADMNNDNKVDMRDIYLAIKNFGKTFE